MSDDEQDRSRALSMVSELCLPPQRHDGLVNTYTEDWDGKMRVVLFGHARVYVPYQLGDDSHRYAAHGELKPFAVTTLVATAAPYRPLGEHRHNQPNISSSHGAR